MSITTSMITLLVSFEATGAFLLSDECQPADRRQARCE
jgi:hypothetical protein